MSAGTLYLKFRGLSALYRSTELPLSPQKVLSTPLVRHCGLVHVVKSGPSLRKAHQRCFPVQLLEPHLLRHQGPVTAAVKRQVSEDALVLHVLPQCEDPLDLGL